MTVPSYGYHGCYLHVDLTTAMARRVALPDSVLRRTIGGIGLGTYLLHRYSRDHQSPLAADAAIVFTFSPLVGSPLTTSAKFAVVCHSPLTGRINDSLSSSHFAITGKKTGYDAIVVTGAATELSSLIIEPQRVAILRTPELAGTSSRLAADRLAATIGGGFRIAAIGVAGEAGVRYATLSHDGRHAGRGGSGAVLGSKRLKAIAVRGDRSVNFANPTELMAISRKTSQLSLGSATEKYRELGTVSNLMTFNRLGMLPTRNFQSGSFAQAAALDPDVMGETHRRTRTSCAACTIGCEHIFEIAAAETVAAPAANVRLEYETLFALGPLCGIDSPAAVLKAARLCDEYGIDTISAGATIAFAMECRERGLLPERWLEFGNAEAVHRCLHEIATRTGLGNRLADGSRLLAMEIGGDAPDFAPHVKGLEIPGYEPRAAQTMALGFAVGTRGADHNRSGAYQVDFSPGVDRLNGSIANITAAIRTEDLAAAMDSLILCKFVRGVFSEPFADMAAMLRVTTGWDIDGDELHTTSARLVDARKWFNIRQGWTAAEDTLPGRFLNQPLQGGFSSGAVLTAETLQQMIQEYYSQRGYSPNGVPDDTGRAFWDVARAEPFVAVEIPVERDN